MAKFLKIHSEVEAYHLLVEPTEDDNQDFHAWADEHGLTWESDRDGAIIIRHPNFGPLPARGGDWIVKGVAENDFYPVKEADFEARYAPQTTTPVQPEQIEQGRAWLEGEVAKAREHLGSMDPDGYVHIRHGLFQTLFDVLDACAETGSVPTPRPASMLKAEDWEAFRAAGLLWWVNRQLHLFGWALVFEVPDGQPDAAPTHVYPARCKFRGFGGDSEDRGFRNLTGHIRDSMLDLLRDAEVEDRVEVEVEVPPCGKCSGERFITERKEGVEVKAWGDDLVVKACPECNADFDMEGAKIEMVRRSGMAVQVRVQCEALHDQFGVEIPTVFDRDVWVNADQLPRPPVWTPDGPVPPDFKAAELVVYRSLEGDGEPVMLFGAWSHKPGVLICDTWEDGTV